jgi:hypothetical protein
MNQAEKTYSILFAQDVPHYGTAEISAATDAGPITRAKELDPGELCTDPAWDDPVCQRIVYIEDPSGNTIAHDIALDGFFLRHAQNIEPHLCDAAPKLLEALGIAIKAMNNVPSFDTGLPDENRPGTTLSSYRLLPRLEAVVREARRPS